MTTDLLSITMKEWESRRPDTDPRLAHLSLESAQIRRIARELSRLRRLEVTELRTGLAIRSFSYVGRLRLGTLQVIITPKIDPPETLLNLLRYAFDFRRLQLLTETPQSVGANGFEDLLVSQLNAEAAELIARGLHRTYQPVQAALASPRGRIDVARMASDGGLVTASLPCRYFPRVEDDTVNRVLLAGLRLASVVATDLGLRRQSRRLAAMLEEQVSCVQLDRSLLERLGRQSNRLTAAYEHALAIIRMLSESRRITLESTAEQILLPGFLFDMNRFFQALVSRFLHEHLEDWQLRDEAGLKGMIRFLPGAKPRWTAPVPRPDFVVMDGARIVAILDAKYRDLWQHRLPREMLYQLALYAGAHLERTATILYPTMTAHAQEAQLVARDPVYGRHLARICLRPIVIPQLNEMVVKSSSAAVDRQRREYARWLVLGSV